MKSIAKIRIGLLVIIFLFISCEDNTIDPPVDEEKFSLIYINKDSVESDSIRVGEETNFISFDNAVKFDIPNSSGSMTLFSTGSFEGISNKVLFIMPTELQNSYSSSSLTLDITYIGVFPRSNDTSETDLGSIYLFMLDDDTNNTGTATVSIKTSENEYFVNIDASKNTILLDKAVKKKINVERILENGIIISARNDLTEGILSLFYTPLISEENTIEYRTMVFTNKSKRHSIYSRVTLADTLTYAFTFSLP